MWYVYACSRSGTIFNANDKPLEGQECPLCREGLVAAKQWGNTKFMTLQQAQWITDGLLPDGEWLVFDA